VPEGIAAETVWLETLPDARHVGGASVQEAQARVVARPADAVARAKLDGRGAVDLSNSVGPVCRPL